MTKLFVHWVLVTVFLLLVAFTIHLWIYMWWINVIEKFFSYEYNHLIDDHDDDHDDNFWFFDYFSSKKNKQTFHFHEKHTYTIWIFNMYSEFNGSEKKINKSIIDDHDQLDNLISMMMMMMIMMIFKTSWKWWDDFNIYIRF
mgnify:FL=1